MDRAAAHRPVLPTEVVELLRPGRCGLIVDCTVGVGGHAELLLSAAGMEARLIGIDRDEANLREARRRLAAFEGRVRLFQANFADLGEVLREAEEPSVDALLADLGVASTQLDDPQRGFSFQADGPLDMRMDPSSGPSAADLVNERPEAELADLIFELGQERFSRRIARAIVASRKQSAILRTAELSRIVERAIPSVARKSRRGVHPATRTFQALRIAVNDELGSLESLLDALPASLATQARVAMISFHSLEDRRVKRAMASWASEGRAELLTRKPITATQAEIAGNPRSRSAKLRALCWKVPASPTR
jgi:16S rRNA (cytosine1402-N4)-methyltransferase